MLDKTAELPTTNRSAIYSSIASLLAIASLCAAVAPIPLTELFCIPGAALLGLVALLTGLHALRQIRINGEQGRPFALLGVWIGGLGTGGMLCALTLGALFLPRVLDLIQHAMN